MLPFEFTVEGTPKSHQARNRVRLQEWRERVRAEARRQWADDPLPIERSLKITVVYYHDRVAVHMDNDNMIKPIQDALNGLVYTDDRQITDTIVRKRNRTLPFREEDVSSVLARALKRDREFVHIYVETAPDHREVLW
jgi:crossover junction endodeoxyribonuclease RusA